jgi:hypothetical protein
MIQPGLRLVIRELDNGYLRPDFHGDRASDSRGPDCPFPGRSAIQPTVIIVSAAAGPLAPSFPDHPWVAS